jgi:prophage regulatory protein
MTTAATDGATRARPKKPVPVSLPATLHPEQRIDYPAVQLLTGWQRSKIAAETRAGRFPQPERDGRRCTRWRAGDVLDYLAKRREQLRREPVARAAQAEAAAQ